VDTETPRYEKFDCLDNHIIGVDAVMSPYGQFEPATMTRDINKLYSAFVGFPGNFFYRKNQPEFFWQFFCTFCVVARGSRDTSSWKFKASLFRAYFCIFFGVILFFSFLFVPNFFSEHTKRVYATGHWGCGAFGGNKELKAIQQIISASEAGQ
jgi:hypothetical protein